MLIPDVNILIYAHRLDMGGHLRSAAWLVGALEGSEQVGLSDHALAGYLRVVTNRRAFNDPTPLERAVDDCTRMDQAASSVRIEPGPDHWRIFTNLCLDTDGTGNDIPDAYLAALAIERNATFVSNDRGFSRFEGLRWASPFA